MVDPGEKRPALYYGKEIEIADAERIESFLTARTARLARADRGSDERQVARSVRSAAVHLVTTLQHSLSYAGPDNDAPTKVRVEISVSWNALWALANPWQWHDEYDHDRWRPVKYWDASHRVEIENILSDAFAKRRLLDASEDDDK
ncbi:hypothetical protein ABZ419_25730 [Streptomyces cinnamoneus]|uniref:hypothetical protein n=1 Tax=Streptomyces cinnamoneus TaxID=53446 RepID=UPI0033D09280